MTDPINIPILTRWTDVNGDHSMITAYAEVTPDLARQIVAMVLPEDMQRMCAELDISKMLSRIVALEDRTSAIAEIQRDDHEKGMPGRIAALEKAQANIDKSLPHVYSYSHVEPVRLRQQAKPVEAEPPTPPAAGASGDDAAVEAIARAGRVAYHYKVTFDEYARAILAAIRAGNVPGVIWSDDYLNMRQIAELAAVKAREKQPEWVSCADRMPDPMTWVLVSDGENVREDRWYPWQEINGRGLLPSDPRRDPTKAKPKWATYENLTHWMPLPSAPRTAPNVKLTGQARKNHEQAE